MNHRKRRMSWMSWNWRRRKARESEVASNVRPPLDPNGRYVGRLIDALESMGALAGPSGPQGVHATNPETGRCVTVVLDHHAGWNRPAWYWRRGIDFELIAPAEEVELVNARIIRAISGPIPEVGRHDAR